MTDRERILLLVDAGLTIRAYTIYGRAATNAAITARAESAAADAARAADEAYIAAYA